MENINGKLYIVPTPIGNLDDTTFKTIKILSFVDYILAEDTRHSIKFLNHFNISKKLVSYYKEVENEKADFIVSDLLKGKNLALISDAGTPGISDPGEVIIKKAIENNIKVEVLPGANAFVPAIVGSGLNTAHFIFYGFLNHSKSKKKKELLKLLNNVYPIIFYESPHRITETLEIIKELYPNRKLSLSRELTKIHEEYLRGTAEEILNILTPKGEFVLIVDSSNVVESIDFKNMDINEHYNFYKSQGLDKKEIIKKISKDLNIHKSEIYKLFI